MSPKLAVAILLLIAVIIGGVFLGTYFKRQSEPSSSSSYFSDNKGNNLEQNAGSPDANTTSVNVPEPVLAPAEEIKKKQELLNVLENLNSVQKTQ